MNKDKGGEAFTRKKIRWTAHRQRVVRDGSREVDDYIVVTGAQTSCRKSLKRRFRLTDRAHVKLDCSIFIAVSRRGGRAGLRLTGYGIYTAARQLDVLPISSRRKWKWNRSAGTLARAVEVLVTRPLENTSNGLGTCLVRSESIAGLSTIMAVFHEGTEHFHRAQHAHERLGEMAGDCPPGSRPR